MPQNALIFECDIMEMGISGGASLSVTTGDGAYSANYAAYYAPDVLNTVTSVVIQIGATTASGGSWYCNVLQCPNAPFGGYSVGGPGSPPPGHACSIRFIDFKLYARFTSADVHAVWSDLEVWVNGAFSVSLGGGSADSAALGPQYIYPRTGIFEMSGSASIGTGSAGGTISGGDRFMIDGVWRTIPTTAPPPGVEPPTSGIGHNGPGGVGGTVTAPFGLTLPDTVTTTSTWGSQIRCEATAVHTESGPDPTTGDFTLFTDRSESGGVLLVVPDPPKSLHRINSGFLASVWRWGTPYVYGSSARGFSESRRTPPDAASSSATTLLYAHAGYGAEELGDSAGDVDAMLTRPVYSCVAVNASREVTDRGQVGGPGGGYVRDHSEAVSYEAPVLSSDSSVEHGQTPYMEHADPLWRYFAGSIGHPWWSLGYVPGDWDLYGSPQRWATDPTDPTNVGYWGYVREQFCAAQGRRNHVVSCPLEVDGYQQFLDAYNTFGETSGKRWLGVSRFRTDDITPAAYQQTDETGSDAWAAVDGSCALSFDASGVTVTGAAGALCKVRLDVGRFDCHPYLYPLICDRITLGWDSANVDSFRAFAATSYGDRSEFAPLTSGAIIRVPRGTSSKYAGSWGYDDGAGVATDGGTDSKPSGVSAALCADAENSHMFRLLEARSPGLIEFDIQLSAGETECLVDWPRWHRAEGTRHLEAENGQVQSFVWQDGPGIRLGNQVFYEIGVGFHDPPLSVGLGYKWTLVDWLCFKRLVLLAQPMTGGTPDLTTELTTIFDAYEVQSVAAAAFGTLAFVLPSSGPEWRMACVHAIGEIPSLAAYPFAARDSAWASTGGVDGGAWAWAQGPRRIVSAGNTPLHLFEPGGTQVTSLVTGTPTGWTITEHSTVVNNSESPDWSIRSGADTWALVTPWHGYLFVGHFADLSGTVHLTADRIGFLYATKAETDRISIRRFDTQSRNDTYDVRLGAYKSAQSAYAPQGFIETHYDDDSGSYYRRSYSSAEQWDAEVSVGAGLSSPAPIYDKTGVGYTAYHVSGDWQLWVTGDDGTYAFRATITTEDDGKTGLCFRDAAMRELAFAVKNRLFVSTDLGFHWTEL